MLLLRKVNTYLLQKCKHCACERIFFLWLTVSGGKEMNKADTAFVLASAGLVLPMAPLLSACHACHAGESRGDIERGIQ